MPANRIMPVAASPKPGAWPKCCAVGLKQNKVDNSRILICATRFHSALLPFNEVAVNYADYFFDRDFRFCGKEKHTGYATGQESASGFRARSRSQNSSGLAELRRGDEHAAPDFSR